MTIMDALAHIDAVKPNSYSQEEKIYWLSVLDGTVKKEIIDIYSDAEGEFDGYTADTSPTTELLIPHPYDDIYVHWLAMRMDLASGEYGRYQNSAELFNSAYTAYERYYGRTHTPKKTKLKFF